LRTAHFVVPDSIDDPSRPSGGNVYDRKVIRSLTGSGWQVREHTIAGPWPQPDESAERALTDTLACIPDNSVVVVDGLLTGGTPPVVVSAAARLRLVVLMHLPLGHQPPGHELPCAPEHERSVLAAASAAIVTSDWARRLLLGMYDDLDPRRVHVAAPGVDAAPHAAGTPLGGQLLCVAAVTWHKGYDLLIDAMSALTELSWQCTCVGVLDREPAFAAELQRRTAHLELADRIVFTGPVVGAALDRLYASADLLLVPSRGETYGMVVSEALARGLPVVAAAVGGVPDTIGRARNGHRPGLLIPPDDAPALAAAIRRWLDDESLRATLRHAASLRRSTLPSWSVTAQRVADVLAEVAA
jgi:glycosyltransferase involved in cell wall biosynthesis